ncbi:MAG TPA: hypothetical protein VJN69_03280 [Candidatus Acidoferrales bacterium]|nr:hypothetical protein [Candidatus Acidoferrales bacterium]
MRRSALLHRKALNPAVFHLSPGQLQLKLVAEDRSHGDDNDSIVGLWHTNYTATFDDNFPPGNAAPTPFPFIQSYKTWHADGTEFENAFLPPTAGNICFGVWKQLSHGTVKLHHIGLMFDATGNVSNVFTIDEIDTVALDGKTYNGTFDFKLFAPDNVFGVGAPISEVKGTIAATRITVN